MEWSPQQSKALDAVASWMKAKDKPVFRVFGYAGTGKTTLARHFAESLKGKTCFAAFTGKASMVMRKSGCHNANTIHSLIYKFKENEKTGHFEFSVDRDSDAKNASLIVIDECSMVGEEIAKDLLSFNTPILVLGDPAQLPPIKGGGYFTDHEPDVMLTEIHRQAGNNPIIRMATDIREGRRLEYGEFDNSKVIRAQDIDSDEVRDASQVLVGKNLTRSRYNRRLRELLGIKGLMPQPGDKLVCLKNCRPMSLLNGSLWTVSKVIKKRAGHIDNNCIELSVISNDFEGTRAVEVSVRHEFFDGDASTIPWQEKRDTQEFDYGYALTVHKSQGSQWDDLVLFDESNAFRENSKQWLYTGITRAAEKITIVM